MSNILKFYALGLKTREHMLRLYGNPLRAAIALFGESPCA